MKAVLIILVVLVAAFLIWFFVTKAKGRCPFCQLQKIFIPRRLTIDTSEYPDYPAPSSAPIMGWSSWNTFGHNINEKIILETAEAMKKSGLADAGYSYINLDDCWQSSLRDENGKWQADMSNFPSGMGKIIATINALGLKAGLYSSNGTLTCEDMPASLGREECDAETIASWGCEYFKYDFCHHALGNGVAPLIECLQISERGQLPFVTLSPDDALYSGMGRTVEDKKLPSGRGIGFISHSSGKAEFKLNAPKKGKYILTVLYRKRFNRREQYLQVKTGGKIFEVFFPVTKAASKTGRAQAIIELESGENTVVICNPIKTRTDAAFLQYNRMGRALLKASEGRKPIVYSICEWGANLPYKWGKKAGNMWRTTPDINASWLSIKTIYSHNVKLWKYAQSGNFNDPDMLEVGNGELTDAENTAHFSLWCMMASPLVLGNDIRKFLNENGEKTVGNRTLEIVTKKELIDIDADPLGKPAKRLKSGAADVIARPLANGDIALCFFNKAGAEKTVSYNLSALKNDNYFGLKNPSSFEATELWSGDKINGSSIAAAVPKHSVKIYRVKVK